MGSFSRRAFLARAGAGGIAAALAATVGRPTAAGAATWRKRLTGADLDTNHRWRVAGTDLGIPYVLENGSIGYLFGDTFDTPWPEGPPLPNDWRSPVLLRSAVHPGAPGGVVFDSAARVRGDGRAPAIMHNGYRGVGIDGVWEVTVIPNDGISFPETGRQLVSYMSIRNWDSAGPLGPHWRTNYAGLAFSDNGNDFVRTPLKWWNDTGNTDPFQMWTMQRDGDHVYVFSVRAGRQQGPMMLRRVHWERMFDPGAYEGWGWNGRDWGWGRPCTPILTGRFGEPSVRRLADGTWVMSYLNATIGSIVTRTAAGPDRAWSAEKVQVGFWQEPGMYGGFVHPWSTRRPNDLHLLVSKWVRGPDDRSTAYHVSQFSGTA
jgi:hypothetical protein